MNLERARERDDAGPRDEDDDDDDEDGGGGGGARCAAFDEEDEIDVVVVRWKRQARRETRQVRRGDERVGGEHGDDGF